MGIQSIRAEQIQNSAVTFAKILSTDIETDLASSASVSKLANASAIKNYVDNQTAAAVFGVKPKQAVRAATITNPLSGTMIADNGTVATGERTYNTTTKTITWFATQGPTAIDGVTLANGDRILVKNETATSGPSAGEGRKYNGIYVRTSLDVWTRAVDFDSVTPIDEINGASVGVQQGTQAGIVFVQFGTVTTFGTDNITFTYYNAIGALASGSGGIGVSGSTISLVLDGSTLSQSGSGVKVAAGGITSTELAVGAVDLTATVVTGTLPITKGGTNSSAALTNSKVMVSVAGAIVESSVTTTELGYLTGVTSAIQTQLNARKVLTYDFGTATTAGEITDVELGVSAGAYDAYSTMFWIINGSVQTDTLTRDDSGNKFTSGNIIIGDVVAVLIYP